MNEDKGKLSFRFVFLFFLPLAVLVSQVGAKSITTVLSVAIKMDSDVSYEENTFSDDFNSVAPEASSVNPELSDGLSWDGQVNEELGRASAILTSVEIDLACSSERLINLSLLEMNVATRESDFESCVSEKNFDSIESVERALEFDLLSGIFWSEVSELEKSLASLQTYIVSASQTISSYVHLGEPFGVMEGKVYDAEESLKELQDQVAQAKMQSANFERTLYRLDGNQSGSVEAGLHSDGDHTNANIKMQTAEQQRSFLRMLEKSLSREMELEKKLTEMRKIEEELKLRLLSSEQEVFCMEEETTDIYGRLFEAEYASVVMKGISKELLGRIHILQFNLNSSTQRENRLKSMLEVSVEMLESKESTLQRLQSSDAKINDSLVALTDSLKSRLAGTEDQLLVASSEASALSERVTYLEKQLSETELELLEAKTLIEERQEQSSPSCNETSDLKHVIEDLKNEFSEAETRAENAEAKCKLLGDINLELNEELGSLKHCSGSVERVETLEKQLRESDIQLQQAVASAEACQEKQSMLFSTIADMDNLIEELKLKVSKEESRADAAEEKCIILSESNADLSEELDFLRGRLQCLEASFNRAEEMKISTAKDIAVHAKVITDLLVQLAVGRECLKQQISALAPENNILTARMKRKGKAPSAVAGHVDRRNGISQLFPEKYSVCAPASTGDIKVSPVTSETVVPQLLRLDKISECDPVGQSEDESTNQTSEFEIRRVDAGVLSLKHIFVALLVLLVSAAAAAYFKL